MKMKKYLKSIIILLFATLFLIASVVVSNIVNKNNKVKSASVNGVGVSTDEIKNKNATVYIDLGKVNQYENSIEKSGMINDEVYICFDMEISDARTEWILYKKDGTQKTRIGRFITTAETDSYER